MMNHATFKASLFMAAGIIDHETGTRDMRRLSGLCRFMPITATLAMVAAAAMAGVPLLNGFLSKEMFFAEALETHDDSLLDRRAAVHRHAGQHVQRRLFAALHPRRVLRPAADRTCRARRTSRRRWMRFPIELLVLACLVVGIVPALTIGPFLDIGGARGARRRTRRTYSLAVWHGFTLPLLMSVVALAGGVALYSGAAPVPRTQRDGPPLLGASTASASSSACSSCSRGAGRGGSERLLGTSACSRSCCCWSCAALVAGAAARVLARAWPATARVRPTSIRPSRWSGLSAPPARSAPPTRPSSTAWPRSILLGGAGLVTCITFVWLSAPDLALTQLVVEIVTTVLLLLGLRWLPKRIERHGRAQARTPCRPSSRLRDLAIAVIAAGRAWRRSPTR